MLHQPPLSAVSEDFNQTVRSRVLVVDTRRNAGKVISQKLGRLGLIVAVAESISTALKTLVEETFDLILLSDSASCDGLIRIRSRFGQSDLPVIVILSESRREGILAALQAGANDFIVRPLDWDIVVARLRLHLELVHCRRALRESEERFNLAALGSNDGLWDWDFRNQRVNLTSRCKAMLGYHDDEIEDSPDELIRRIHVEDIDRLENCISRVLEGKESNLNCEIRLLHRDNGYRWMICRGVAVRDCQKRVYRMAGSLTDVTEGRVGDPLTGLPNRLLFMDRLERAMERHQRDHNKRYAVVFLDLDHFKKINDTYGHHIGDQVLLAVSKRLKTCLRTTDSLAHFKSEQTIARHAGDEFTIILEDFESENEVQTVIDRILHEVAQPIDVQFGQVSISVSVGWIIGHCEHRSAEDILQQVDEAMYQSKAKGRNCAVKYHASMQERSRHRNQRHSEIQHGILKSQFLLHFLPVMQLRHHVPIGYEALVRWRHPQEGLLLPGKFVPIAEETGLIHELGWSITNQAAAQSAIWQAQFPAHATELFINFSTKQLLDSQFKDRFALIIKQTGVIPSRLCVEVSEKTLIENFEVLVPVLLGIEKLGVRVAIDDFGTGYASLGHLNQLPIDTLKIDRSLVCAVDRDGQSRQLVKTIVDMAENLNLQVIAEGVETESQRKSLTNLGCLFGQGFLWSSPLSAQAATNAISVGNSSLSFLPFPSMDYLIKSNPSEIGSNR